MYTKCLVIDAYMWEMASALRRHVKTIPVGNVQLTGRLSLRVWSELKLIAGFEIERKAGRATQVMTSTSYLPSLPLSRSTPPDIPYFIFHHFHSNPPLSPFSAALSEMKILVLLIHSGPLCGFRNSIFPIFLI